MGKEAREARRMDERLARRHPAALAAATMADELFARRWRGAEQDYSLLLGQARRRQTTVRLHVEEIHGYVNQLRSSGYDWAAATYLPMPLLASELVRSLYRDTGQAVPRDDVSREPAEQFAMYLAPQVATLTGWHRAPLVALFDDDLAAALLATPMTGELPHTLLQQLPAWTVFIPTPWLAAGTGVFVAYDAANITRYGLPFAGVTDGVDDLILLFVSLELDKAVNVYVRCSEPTIEASIAAQEAELAGRLDPPPWLGGAHAYFEGTFGRPYRRVLEEVMSLVLYLCSEEPDAVPVTLPRRGALRNRRAADRQVLEVGYRVGAALRAPRAQGGGDGGGTHARPAPHVRAAHWHTYRYGPRAVPPAQRMAKLRWLAPILVNADERSLETTVRPVHAKSTTERVEPAVGRDTKSAE